jgi:hypothetical protein
MFHVRSLLQRHRCCPLALLRSIRPVAGCLASNMASAAATYQHVAPRRSARSRGFHPASGRKQDTPLRRMCTRKMIVGLDMIPRPTASPVANAAAHVIEDSPQ